MKPGFLLRRVTGLALLTGLLLGSALPARAAQVERLFEASAPVANQQPDERTRAVKDAFVRLLVKLTGSSATAQRPDLGPLVEQSPKFVQQYGYRYVQPVPGMPAPSNPAQVLTVVFDEGTVSARMREAGLPLWGANRPSILLWGVINGRTFFSPDTQPDLNAGLVDAAGQRGMALFFPLMDLEDQTLLQPGDLFHGNDAAVMAASQRYGTDVVVTASFAGGGGRWEGSWTMLDRNQQRTSWTASGESLFDAAAAGLQAAADGLAERYAPAAAASQEVGVVRLRIAGVNDLLGYARVTGLMSRLSSVERSTLISAQGDLLYYQLTARGGAGAVQQELTIGGLLEPDAGGAPQDTATVDLSFRLRR